MNAPDGYVGDRAGGGFLSNWLSNCRSAVLLLLALLIIAPSAMAIDEVIIKHKEGDTWSSHAEGASPWQSCHDADSSGEPFKAVAAGFIDTNDDPSDDPDKPINWKVVITNTETGDPTVLVDCSDTNDKGYHAGDEIEFDMPLDTAGPYKLTATATNAENDDDSASDTDEVWVVKADLISLSPSAGLELGDDLSIEYELDGPPGITFDSVELEVFNKSYTFVYKLDFRQKWDVNFGISTIPSRVLRDMKRDR